MQAVAPGYPVAPLPEATPGPQGMIPYDGYGATWNSAHVGDCSRGPSWPSVLVGPPGVVEFYRLFLGFIFMDHEGWGPWGW